jgi:hypothetical protein
MIKRSKGLERLKSEYRETPSSELRWAVVENYFYGLLGSVIFVFVSYKIDIAVLIGYMIYYFYLSRVINRPKYVTSLGKFIVFPVPTALGAFSGYKIAGYLSIFLMRN